MNSNEPQCRCRHTAPRLCSECRLAKADAKRVAEGPTKRKPAGSRTIGPVYDVDVVARQPRSYSDRLAQGFAMLEGE